MGNFLKDRLFKTRENIFGRIKNLISGKNVTKEMSGEIEEILITSDISATTAGDILKNTFDEVKGSSKEAFVEAVKGKKFRLEASRLCPFELGIKKTRSHISYRSERF